MNPVTSERFDIEKRPGQFPDDLCLIIGAGYFGKRAATILKEMSASPILIVDRSEERLAQVSDLPVEKIAFDGVGFLADNFHVLNSGAPCGRMAKALSRSIRLACRVKGGAG